MTTTLRNRAAGLEGDTGTDAGRTTGPVPAKPSPAVRLLCAGGRPSGDCGEPTVDPPDP